jgi:hypothetical protein
LIVIAQKLKVGGKGGKKWERGGCEARMGGDLLAVLCAGGRRISDGCETINREKEWKTR